MKIIFLGLMFFEKFLDEAYRISKSGIQMAPHKFQTNLLCGMREIAPNDITVLNIPPMGSFPKNCRRLFLPKYKWEQDNIQLGYLNLPYIKHLQQKRSLKKYIEKQLEEYHDIRILIYSLYAPFVHAASEIKKEYPKTQIYLIQPDAVPGRNDMEKYMTEEAKHRGDKLVALCKNFTGFVLFSKYLAEPLEVGNRSSVVIECICDQKQIKSKASDGTKNICLYMGALEKAYSICELAQAFMKLENGELWLCGKGDAEKEIIDLAQKCNRIKYFGYVDIEKGNELRNKCDYLINPRRPSGTYTLYSFPSKTVEYMLSAKPVIMYKLEAIPDEYDEYLNYLHADNIDGLAHELKSIFDIDYSLLVKKATKGREFVLREKNGRKQAEKIFELMK